ncbi:MAG: hypothetical protein RMK92_11180, partial [Armatimonadota bacterium]|nr:hypothetical protein [Armatimonadota bacterium]
MELVQVVVKRRHTENGTELHVQVQTTPVGSLLVGATAIWMGAKVLKMLRRRWWLPVGMGAATLLLRRLSAPAASPRR